MNDHFNLKVGGPSEGEAAGFRVEDDLPQLPPEVQDVVAANVARLARGVRPGGSHVPAQGPRRITHRLRLRPVQSVHPQSTNR